MSKKTWSIGLLIGCLAVLAPACSKSVRQSPEIPSSKETVERKATEGTDEKAGTGQTKVLMMGRSVMGGWFGHWDSDTSSPVKKGRFTLYYKELETPPDIADSAEEYISEVDDKDTILFFKFCFDDFSGSSREEAQQSLKEKKQYVEQVFDAAKDRNLKLIIGNALPRVKTYTDSHLVWNHRKFNAWLDEFAAKHSDEVYIFDQYGVLTDSNGNLKAEYAIDKEDSHLNDSAYDELDKPFFDLLNQNFK